MKNICLATLLLLSFSAYSQTRPIITHTERGMKMVGAQLQLSYSDLFNSETILSIDDYSSTYGVMISPNIGWFVEKNWMFGVMGHAGFYRDKSGKNVPTKSSENSYDLGITPFSRYYIDLARRGNIKVFLQAGLPVIYSNYDRSTTSVFGTQTYTSRSQGESLGLYGNFGFGASLHGRFGAIELNASNLGINLGLHKFIARRAK